MDLSKQYDVFISYRGVNSTQAAVVFTYLDFKQYRVFMDAESLGAGRFDEQLYHVIDHVTDLILILTKDTLGNCMREDDWIRREVGYALKLGKNVVPFMFDYTFPNDLELPDEIKLLPKLHGVKFHQDMVKESLERLRKHLKSLPCMSPDPAPGTDDEDDDDAPEAPEPAPPVPADSEPLEPEVEISPVKPTGKTLRGRPRYTKEDLQRARADLLDCLNGAEDGIAAMLKQEWIDSRAAYRAARTAMIYASELMGAYDWPYEPDSARGKFINNYENTVSMLRQFCTNGSVWLSKDMKKLLTKYNRGLRELIQALSNGR